MASIFSQNPLPPSSEQSPKTLISNIANQILRSANPQEAFQQVLQQNKEAQNAWNLINQYGNGDPKAAFMNYASQTGKQGLAQQILQKLGIG